MGVWGAVAGSGGAAGVLLGGMLTEWLGWEWVLFVNVPIGLAAAALAPRLLPESRSEERGGFDLAGAISITAGLSLLVYALVDANDAGWGSLQTLGLGALALGLIAAFVAIETRVAKPLVPFGIFRLRTLTGANVVALLVAAALFAMFFFVSLYMQQVLGYDALKAGLSYLPLALGIILSAGIASPLVTRFGFKPVLVSGLVLVAGALVWFAQVSPDGSYVGDILFPSLLAAVGLGFAFVPMMVASLSDVPAHEAGLASGLINTSQQIGGALGLAILATVATARTEDAMVAAQGDPAALPAALTEGFQSAFLVGAGFAVVGRTARHGVDLEPRQPRARGGRPRRPGGRARARRGLTPPPAARRPPRAGGLDSRRAGIRWSDGRLDDSSPAINPLDFLQIDALLSDEERDDPRQRPRVRARGAAAAGRGVVRARRAPA